MRLAIRGMALVAAIVMSLGLVTGAGEKRTLKGAFEWSDEGYEGDLKAVFTPTGEGTWDVAFHFEFQGQQHVYAGTAEGTLAGGELKGRVLNEDKKRAYLFTGTFTDGEFHGTHSEVRKGGDHTTGTLTLKG